MADSAGKGILIVAVCHGLAQLEARWDSSGARAIWDTAGIKVILGGVSDPDTLDGLSRLCGEIELRTHSRAHDEYGRRGHTVTDQPVQVLPPELLRMLPEWRALVVRGNLSPVVIGLRMAWRRLDYQSARHTAVVPRRPLEAAVGGRARPPRLRTDVEEEPGSLALDGESCVGDEPDRQPVAADEVPTEGNVGRPDAGSGGRTADDAPPLPPELRDGTVPRPRRPWEAPADNGNRR